MIIAGIDHTGTERHREYVPYRSMHPMMLRAQGRRYPDFLIKEVMPFVENAYRVATSPRNTGLGGSSLGALIAFCIQRSRGPGVIGRLLLESPSLWAGTGEIIKESRVVRIGRRKYFWRQARRKRDVRSAAARWWMMCGNSRPLCGERCGAKSDCACDHRGCRAQRASRGASDFRRRCGFYLEVSLIRRARKRNQFPARRPNLK